MNTNIGIPEKHRHAVALELNKVLADEYVLYTKLRNYHWNVEADNFMEMHNFYESQADQLDKIIDEIAERVRALGYYSSGRMQDFLAITHLDEPDYTSKRDEQLANLLSDHETLIQIMRALVIPFAEEHQDLGSSDFITGLMEQHEKMAWFIRSYLAGTQTSDKKSLKEIKYEHQ